MPHEDNAIVDNDIFWNNFNYYAGAPFKLRETAVGGVPYPPGVGLLLFGGRTTKVEGNRIWGNYLVGHGQVSQFLLEDENKPSSACSRATRSATTSSASTAAPT